MGTINKNAIPDEYKSRFILSSLCDDSDEVPSECDGITFLKKILELTKTRAEPKAQSKPIALEAETSDEHANMTPMVRGRSEI
jgi:hypothetical protein